MRSSDLQDMTVRDFCARVGLPFENLLFLVLESRDAGEVAPARPSSTKPKKKPPTNAPSNDVNTRTIEGRNQLDAAIIECVSKADEPISANSIRSETGGTPQQVRTALNRLIEQGKMKFSGRARGTKYFV